MFLAEVFFFSPFQCPIPLGEEMQEVAETSGFLNPSFMGACSDPLLLQRDRTL